MSAVVGLAALALSASSSVANAAGPSTSPTPSTSSVATQVATPVASAGSASPAATATSPTPVTTASAATTPVTTGSVSPSATRASASPATSAAVATAIKVSVSCAGVAPAGGCVGPQTYAVGRGYITLTGTAVGAPAGTKLIIRNYSRSTNQPFAHSSVVTTANGAFQWHELASVVNTISYDVTTADGRVVSPKLTIKTVPAPAAGAITLAASSLSVDTLKLTRTSGTLSTHQANVGLDVYINTGTGWRYHSHVTTGANGAFSLPLDYSLGIIGKVDYQVRWGSVSSPVLHVAMTPYTDFSVGPVSTSLVYRTYHSGCPVTPAMLTKLSMTYYGFDGRAHTGYLVVRSAYVKNYEAAFATALSTRFPIRQMHDPSVYGNDEVSMANDNTYAFYCRQVSGNRSVLSPHSYGTSVDVNTVENPYEEPNGVWKPTNGASYVSRRNVRPGMFMPTTPFTRAFLNNGFMWLGAASHGAFDYQHFQIR